MAQSYHVGIFTFSVTSSVDLALQVSRTRISVQLEKAAEEAIPGLEISG
jgi:hypothetical protein